MRALGDSDPRHVGPYRLLAGLDGDEMGLVLLGGAPDGRLAAVKLVSQRVSADGGFPQRFAREVAALRHVSGIHTAPVVDAGAAEAVPWLASEFLPGPSLRQVIERGVLLGEDAVLLLAAGLVGALTEIHRVGLVHRDLTPANVRLTESGVRVYDFGVARAVDRDVSQVIGAPEFMSPEQASGQAVTPASDVFSLGAVLYLAVTGRNAFAGATRAETLTHVVRAQPELSASLPASVRRLLAACFVREPHQRPTLHDLTVMIGPVPPGVYPWPPLVRSMIAEQHAEIARLVGGAPVAGGSVAGAPAVDAPTIRIAPVVVPAPPPRRKVAPRQGKSEPKRWRPDMWAIVSGAAVVLTIVFAVVMFNLLTPDRPIKASQQESAGPTETIVTTTTTTTTATTTQQAVTGEVTGLADKCMDVAGARSDNGTPVQLYECNGTNAQQWVFTPDGSVQSLGKCLDVRDGDTDDGTKVQIDDCDGSGAQQWTAGSDGRIVNVEADKCLDVPASATDDGTQLVIWTCHGEENQLWTTPA